MPLVKKKKNTIISSPNRLIYELYLPVSSKNEMSSFKREKRYQRVKVSALIHLTKDSLNFTQISTRLQMDLHEGARFSYSSA